MNINNFKVVNEKYLCVDDDACVKLISRLSLIKPIIEKYNFKKHCKFILKIR